MHQKTNKNTFTTINNARVYVVGGAVRDKLLGINSVDKDWLVVGATPQDMLNAGFTQVGKEFPVFLHPQTHEEYALARTEYKSGHGYKGFNFSFLPTTSLEEDLLRRDLTINAIAEDNIGNIIDPYNGQADLKNRILRHVSSAFVEDPLRVLRVARFAAQLAPFGFHLAAETQQLMQQISTSEELCYLQAERVWQETARALQTSAPHIFIQTLRDCQALKIIYPEIDILFGIPQTPKYHPEIDTGIHTLMVMERSALLSSELCVRFAAMTHDLGKGTTPQAMLPRHIGHELRSYDLLQKLYARIPIPKDCQELADKVAKFHLHAHRAFELRTTTILNLLKQLDAFRKPQLFENYLLSCLADSQGRTGFEQRSFPEIDYLRNCFEQARNITAQHVLAQYAQHEQVPQGKALGIAIDRERITQIASVKKNWQQRKKTSG